MNHLLMGFFAWNNVYVSRSNEGSAAAPITKIISSASLVSAQSRTLIPGLPACCRGQRPDKTQAANTNRLSRTWESAPTCCISCLSFHGVIYDPERCDFSVVENGLIRCKMKAVRGDREMIIADAHLFSVTRLSCLMSNQRRLGLCCAQFLISTESSSLIWWHIISSRMFLFHSPNTLDSFTAGLRCVHSV